MGMFNVFSNMENHYTLSTEEQTDRGTIENQGNQNIILLKLLII